MLGKGLVKGLLTTLKHLPRPAVTVQYPTQKREPTPRFRGRHGMRVDENGEPLCIGCKQCERLCPDRLITVKTEKAPEGSKKKLIITEFTVDVEACMFCGLCEDVCPVDAVVLTRFYEMATQNRKEIFMRLDKLIDSGRGYDIPE